MTPDDSKGFPFVEDFLVMNKTERFPNCFVDSLSKTPSTEVNAIKFVSDQEIQLRSQFIQCNTSYFDREPFARRLHLSSKF